MSRLYLLRHGRTQWNVEQRIQGRTDIPLSSRGEAALAAISLPARWLSMDWYTSPLIRAQQTASLLGAREVTEIEALIETNWGQFEGLTLKQIDLEITARNLIPDRGLDLLPPGGESPRMVRSRFDQWLRALPPLSFEAGRFCVTHKGVIRAALSLATGWNMQKAYPDPVDWQQPLAFRLHGNGSLELDAINLPWQAGTQSR